MSPSDRNASLAFLLSLGSMPIGCLLVDDGNDSDTNAGTQGTGGNDDGTGNASNASTVTAGTNMTSAGATDGADTVADGTVGPGSGYADSGYASGGSGGLPTQCEGVQIPAECTAYAAKVAECEPTYAAYQDEIAQQCACSISYYAPMGGADCPGAYSDLYACIGGLSCADYMAETGCMSELDAQVMACGGGGTGGAESGGTGA